MLPVYVIEVTAVSNGAPPNEAAATITITVFDANESPERLVGDALSDESIRISWAPVLRAEGYELSLMVAGRADKTTLRVTEALHTYGVC